MTTTNTAAASDARDRQAFYLDAMGDKKNHGALALELAFLRSKVDSLAAPAQPVAHVSQETFNDDGTSDIIIPALPIGMALYAALAAPARAVPAPVKRTVWVNLYGRQLESVCHPTEEDADKHASPNRIGGKAYPLEIEEGAQAVPAVPAIGQTDFDAVAPTQAGEYPPSSADMVMAALDTEEWGLERMQRWDCITDEGNRVGAWLVKRQKAPYCAVYTDKPGAPYGPRSWSGPTALDALQKAADDLDIRLPQPAARGAAQAAPVDAESWLDLLADARAALWQPANAALCERLDAFIDAARAAQKGNHD